MKVDNVGGYTFAGIKELKVLKKTLFDFYDTETLMRMEDEFVGKEINEIRTLCEPLKRVNIKRYDIPLLKILLTTLAFGDNKKVLEEIPHMLSIRWPREIDNNLCAEGRKNIAILYATTPILHENKAFNNKISEVLSNCTTKESADYTIAIINKYLSNKLLYGNKNLSEKLPEIIIKMQDSLYDSRVDEKGILQSLNKYMDLYVKHPYHYGYCLGDILLNNPGFNT